MKTAVAPPMQQHPVEFAILLDFYRQLQPERVLEVGVGEGGTLYQWLQNASGGAVVVAVDDRHRGRGRYGEWTPAGVELVTITGNSHDQATVIAAYEHGNYDWVFIDADHHDADVRLDWLNYGRMTTPDGVVVFHDVARTGDPTIEVDRLWAELRTRHRTTEICEDDGYGYGVVFSA